MIGNYEVATLGGSTKFKEEFVKAQKELNLQGKIAISVGLFGHGGDIGKDKHRNQWTFQQTQRRDHLTRGLLIFRKEGLSTHRGRSYSFVSGKIYTSTEVTSLQRERLG